MAKVEKLIIVLIDIDGFAKHCEGKKPEELFRFMSNYYAVADNVISALNGTVIKFIGDAVLSTFPTSITSNLEVTFHNLKTSFETWLTDKIPDCRVNIKAHIGQVAIGEISTMNHKWTDIIGKEVNKTFLLYGKGIVFSNELLSLIDR